MPEVNIAIELVSFFVTAVLLVCSFIDKNCGSSAYRIFTVMLVINALILADDMLAWHLTGRRGFDTLLYIDVSIGYCLGYVISCLLSHYIVRCIGAGQKRLRSFVYAMNGVCALAIMLVIVSSFNKMYFSYEDGVHTRGEFYWLSQLFPIFMLAANELVVLQNRKSLGRRYTLSLLSYGVLPITAMIVQLFLADMEITYTAATLSLMIIHVRINTEQAIALQQKETELEKTKLSLMLSQIKPHFLYNVLGTIGYLCKENPQTAKNTTLIFSKYLRYNIDSVTTDSLIPFESELEHIEKYLSLEKIRYGDKMRVQYAIEEKEFLIPVLSIQPLVENAVAHGVSGKRGGGTVRVAVFSGEDCRRIVISDDGVGFDADEALDRDRHTSLANVKTRLELQCGGSLRIESAADFGTRAVVIIPRQAG